MVYSAKPKRRRHDRRALAARCRRTGSGNGSKQAASDDAAWIKRSLVVLAVDDDGLVLTNTVAMLDDLGHTGIAASSGKEALDILRQQDSVDLVITDYAMPQMTGLQLADAIKKEWPELPVIIATGFAEMEPETRSSSAEACEAVHRGRARQGA